MTYDDREDINDYYPSIRPGTPAPEEDPSVLETHLNSRNNPHVVTAEQVDTYTKSVIDGKINTATTLNKQALDEAVHQAGASATSAKMDAERVDGAILSAQSIANQADKAAKIAQTMRDGAVAASNEAKAVAETVAGKVEQAEAAAKRAEEAADSISVDDALSNTSTHPVQNKVIKAELDKKATTEALGYCPQRDDSPNASSTFGNEFQDSDKAAFLTPRRMNHGNFTGFAFADGVLKWVDNSGVVHTEELGGNGGSITADETLSATSTNPIQNQWLGKRMGATASNSVQIGYDAKAGAMGGQTIDGSDGDNGGQVAIGKQANGNTSGAAMGYGANGSFSGAAVGYNASGYSSGAAVGAGAKGYSSGAAVGYGANGSNSGVAVGYSASGYSYCVAVGFNAQGYYSSVAVGYGANGSNSGVAVGYNAQGNSNSVAVGYNASGNSSGTAVGCNASGGYGGVAVGRGTNGSNSGVAVGFYADGNGTGRMALGNEAIATGENAVAIGYQANNSIPHSTLLSSANRADGTFFGIRIVAGEDTSLSYIDFVHKDPLSGTITGRRVSVANFLGMLDDFNITEDLPAESGGGSSGGSY